MKWWIQKNRVMIPMEGGRYGVCKTQNRLLRLLRLILPTLHIDWSRKVG